MTENEILSIIAILIIPLVMSIMLIECWKEQKELEEYYEQTCLDWWRE